MLRGEPIPILKPTSSSDDAQAPFNYAPIMANEIQVIGARCGNINDGLRAMSTGGIDLSGLITKQVPFADAINAFRLAQDDEQIAVIVNMEL